MARPSSAEERAFNKWLENTYGAFRAIGIQLGFGSPWWEENTYYDNWVNMGKPGLEEITGVPAERLTVNEFFALQTTDPEEYMRILQDPSGKELPDMSGTGYTFDWAFSLETGQAWQLAGEDTGVGIPEPATWEEYLERQRELLDLERGPYSEERALAELQLLQKRLADFGEMTPSQQANFDLDLQRLEWEMQQYGTLSAAQAAELNLAREELGLRRNEWLAGLQAQPATFIERWYAEHLPAGTEMPAYTPWGTAPVGTEEWMQQYETPAYGGVGQPTTISGVPTGGGWQPPSAYQGGVNPWITAQGTPDIETINRWTGRLTEGAPPTSMSISGGAGYRNLPSYEQHMRAYPNSNITPEAYYSDAGAYELAAYYNPAYAYGAQRATMALKSGEITRGEYQSMQQANFVDASGNPLVPLSKWAEAAQTTAAGWAQAQSPPGTVGRLQAQGIPPSDWASQVKYGTQEMQGYVGAAAEALQAPLPGGGWKNFLAQGQPGWGGGVGVTTGAYAPQGSWGTKGYGGLTGFY